MDLVCQWDGEHLRPLAGHRRAADAGLVIGMRYAVTVAEPRSMKAHRRYFAAIHDLWQSLPEALSARFPNSEILRKWALIRAGYRDETIILGKSPADATKIAALAANGKNYAVVTTEGPMVTVMTPKSQSVAAMGEEEFRESCDAVENVIADMIGIEPERRVQ